MSFKASIGISQGRQDIIRFAICNAIVIVFGSSLALLAEYEISCAAEGDVEQEDEAEDEGEGAEEDGAIVGVEVGQGGGGGEGGGEEATERTI